MKSSIRERAKFIGKKYRKLNRITKRKIYFTELLIRNNDKYLSKKIKYFIFYSLWTHKTVKELEERLDSLDTLIKDSEKFTDEYHNKLRAWT